MMALRFSTRLIAAIVVLSCAAVASLSPAPATKGFNVNTLTFDEGYAPLFGDGNLVRLSDGRSVHLHLNRYSGSGFISSDLYQYGLFSASIKLPSNYTAGVVVAFYTSNGDLFEKTHDELDLEFLGNIKGREWRLQTNVYGNGSTSRGREERYLLPFDPTAEAHRYSILWTSDSIIFYVDETPIREVKRSEAMGADYPTKPMMLYATIWDGSSWATSGGKYKVNYKYSPFIAEFSDLVLRGCRMDPIQQLPVDEQCANAEAELAAADYSRMTPEKRQAMRKFRERYMTYSFCYDTLRYPITFPDCEIVRAEQRRFTESGDVKNMPRRRRSKHRSKFFSGSVDSERQADM